MEPKVIFDKTISFLRKKPRYLLVFFVFIFAIFYYHFIIPPQASKGNKASKEKVQTVQPDLDVKRSEKIYSHILQSQAGDVFRVGAFADTKNTEDIEIFAESELNEVLKIGEWHLEPSENGEYKELFFSAPGRYENIVLRLQKNEERDAAVSEQNKTTIHKKWDDSAVYIRSFFVSRVEARDALELRNLTPTVFGISSLKRDILQREEDAGRDAKEQSNLTEWVFQSNGDSLQALEFSGKKVGSGRQEYVFSLRRYFPDKKEKEGELLHTAAFVLDALDDLLVSMGNYRIPFPFPLVQGEWYKMTLAKTPSKDKDNSFTVGPLEADVATNTDSTGDLALLIRERLRAKNDASFPDGAKFEDLGERFFYFFSLNGTPLDFANVFDASGSIRYDVKKHLVTGGQKNKEYLIYKFNMPYPFNRFVLEATQEGNDEKEIKLEYSFDNAFWREIAFTQEPGDAQEFLLTLEGDDKSRTVYVRASYTGPEKKSGFFALKALNVTASIGKTR
ncbi:MAG: hypothetical protein Q7S04_03700 [Candidatus Moranbacteria bacterium]|nr:hypothetical protein [Candidatus Moranbacteria bacterium]